MTVIRELQTVFVASIEMLANQSLQATPHGAPELVRKRCRSQAYTRRLGRYLGIGLSA